MKTSKNINIKNRRAEHDFFVIDRYTAGICLAGPEIKSIREGKASLVDTFCYVHDGEMWVKNMYIAPYAQTSFNATAPRRDRKLLLSRKEIRHLEADSRATGYSIVPLRLYLSEKGWAKLDIALCRGKKDYDKRATLQEKQQRRELDLIKKQHGRF